MIHIVFEPANVQALKKSFELDESLSGDIVVIQDDFAVGPIANLFTAEGAAMRLQWWQNILAGTPFEGLAHDGHVHDNEDVAQLKKRLDEAPETEVWIWAAQNKHDVSGYYWLVSQLKAYQGKILLLYLNNLPFINEKGNLFYPSHLFEITPREFVKAKKLARVITPSEFEVDPDEWERLAAEDKGVRLLEGGKKLVQRGYDYYDAELLKFIGKDWQKVNKMFGQFFSKAKETTGDAYLLWRLNQMAAAGKVDMQGNIKNLKDIEVRLAQQEAV